MSKLSQRDFEFEPGNGDWRDSPGIPPLSEGQAEGPTGWVFRRATDRQAKSIVKRAQSGEWFRDREEAETFLRQNE